MSTIFGYHSSDIEAQYKQERYLKEAEQYRFMRQRHQPEEARKFLENIGRLRVGTRRLHLSHNGTRSY